MLWHTCDALEEQRLVRTKNSGHDAVAFQHPSSGSRISLVKNLQKTLLAKIKVKEY